MVHPPISLTPGQHMSVLEAKHKRGPGYVRYVPCTTAFPSEWQHASALYQIVVLTGQQQMGQVGLPQGVEIRMGHVPVTPNRITNTEGDDEDDSGSVDSTLTVERDAIYTQSGFIAGGSSSWESTYDPGSIYGRTDQLVYEAVADEIWDDRLQAADPAESNLQSSWFEIVSAKQHEITISSSNDALGHDATTRPLETGPAVIQPDPGQVVDLDDDKITDDATSEDDQSTASEWPSQTPSADEDVDAHNMEVAVDDGHIPSDKVIVDPVVGKVYQCLWNDGDGDLENRVWYFATPLPFGDYGEIGISGNLIGSQLCDGGFFPSCCRRTSDDQRPLTWAPGFEDGGSAVKRRKFPFLFLQKGLEIPAPANAFILPRDSPFTAWIDVKVLLPEDHQHGSGLHMSHLTGLNEGAAVVNAFKSRLTAIQESREAGLRYEFASSSLPPTSASAIVDSGAQLVVSSLSDESLGYGSGYR